SWRATGQQYRELADICTADLFTIMANRMMARDHAKHRLVYPGRWSTWPIDRDRIHKFTGVRLHGHTMLTISICRLNRGRVHVGRDGPEAQVRAVLQHGEITVHHSLSSIIPIKAAGQEQPMADQPHNQAQLGNSGLLGIEVVR